MIKIRKTIDRDTREKIKHFGPAIVIMIIGFVITFQFVESAPPMKIVMGTGSPQGAYHAFGKAYRETLAREGITLVLKDSSGSVDNLRMLETPSDGVDVAFVQSGLATLARTDTLVSLGSLFLEPLWIFCRKDLSLVRLPDMKGLRVAVGPEGSGTKELMMQLLELNDVTAKNTRIFFHDLQKAADMLLAGEIDVAAFVTSHHAKYIPQLVKSGKIKLMGIERAEAYALRYKFLHVLVLPEGVIDFKANAPSRDLALLAPTSQLVARSDLHPALIDVLLQAAEEVHYKSRGFEREGQFPTARHTDFKLSVDAALFYQSGPSFFQRYLPFWAANFLSRMKVMLLPLVVLLFPFFKLMPPIYHWRMRSRIYRWYRQLESIDAQISTKQTADNLDRHIARLDDLEKNLSHIHVPLAFQDELYNFRLHIELLRKRIQRIQREENAVEKQ
ncbi:MAG: ABC transporter substrate-binding protein [Thermodesulfovibrionia bacterium]|nr:ABC transporter substrate-binding protein [Thermodesulfovibrionia bacterium]